MRSEEAGGISKYLEMPPVEEVLDLGAEKPLFQNLDGCLRPVGERLTGNSIYYIVSRYRSAVSSQIHQATLSPRDLRDGAIETALQRVGGEVGVVAQHFPHIRPSILSTYWPP